MRYLPTARNIILLRVSVSVLLTVTSTDMTGFYYSGSLTDTKGVTKPYDAAYRSVSPELHRVGFPNLCQVYFNPNGKFGCMVLSSM